MSTGSMYAEKQTKYSNCNSSKRPKDIQSKTMDRFEPLGYLYENDVKSETAIIQAKLKYNGNTVTKKTLDASLVALEAQEDLGLSDPALRAAVISILTYYIFNGEETLDAKLVRQTRDEALEKLESKRGKQRSNEEALAFEQRMREEAANLFEYLKGQPIQEMSAGELKLIFEEKGFEVKQEISEESTVLGTIIVTASAEGRDYLYVEIHPKGGIHYSSYVLIGLYAKNKEVIKRHKVVLSKSNRYLGKKEEEEARTTFNFLQDKRGFSNLKSGRYPHRSRYFPTQAQEGGSESHGKQPANERKAFLETKKEELFAKRPIEMAKSKQMLAQGFWDEMLYLSVRKMKIAKQRALQLKQEAPEHATEDTEVVESLVSRILKLEMDLYDLEMDTLEQRYRLEKIGRELDELEQKLMAIESNIDI